MERLRLTVDEVLTTTRTVRKRIDFERPVERKAVVECLEAALQSPSGSNAQGWRWIVVTDPDRRLALAEVYREGWEVYRTHLLPHVRGETEAQVDRISESALYMAENFERYPVMLVPCIPRVRPEPTAFEMMSRLGSIMPGIWSFMLAARERGLGTAWTTIHLMHEERAAEVLGIPFERYAQCALVTVGHTIGTDFKPATRSALESVVHWDSWDPTWVN